MKELIKPNIHEQNIGNEVEAYCELNCRREGREGVCNKACDCRTYSNDSVMSGDEIIF